MAKLSRLINRSLDRLRFSRRGKRNDYQQTKGRSLCLEPLEQRHLLSLNIDSLHIDNIDNTNTWTPDGTITIVAKMVPNPDPPLKTHEKDPYCWVQFLCDVNNNGRMDFGTEIISTDFDYTDGFTATYNIDVPQSTHYVEKTFFAIYHGSPGDWAGVKLTIYDNGTGTTTHVIQDVDDLQAIPSTGTSGQYYLMVQDIDASDTENWNSGAGFDPIDNFAGTFDGRGYEIADLYINRDDETNGIFGGHEPIMAV